MLVKMVNRIKEATETPADAAEAAPAGPSELEVLLEIRDALRRD
jgi:large conductance mechanosensitive channel